MEERNNADLPLVSIIIPTYKRPVQILRTVNTVLSQTYRNMEIIVVDDNGVGARQQQETEALLMELIESGKITYIAHESNKNGSAARNTGLNHSHGEYINFIDDDDRMLPNKIEKQVRRLKSSDDTVGATYCNSIIRHYQNITHKLIEKTSDVSLEGNLCREYILGIAKFNTSMIMFKRSAIEHIGGFDESFIRHQDYELMIRFFRHYNIVCTGVEPLAVYDQTSDRINTPNCKKDFLMKEKLLSLFMEDFKRLGIGNEITHYLWLRCAINSAMQRDGYYFQKSLELCKKYGNITLKEYVKLVKSIGVALLKSI